MSVVFRAGSGGHSNTALTSFVPTLPTGTAIGDVTFIYVQCTNPDVVYGGATSGWVKLAEHQNSLGTDLAGVIYGKVWTTTPANPTVTFVDANGVGGAICWSAAAFSPGAGGTLSFDNVSDPGRFAGAGTSFPVNGRTPTASEVASVVFSGERSNTVNAATITGTLPADLTQPINVHKSTTSGTFPNVGTNIGYRLGVTAAYTPGNITTNRDASSSVWHLMVTETAPPHPIVSAKLTGKGALSTTVSSSGNPDGGGTSMTAYLTGYSYPDNDPPDSDAIAYPTAQHPVAGGTGTYADPITMATAAGEWAPGTIFYVPALRRYFRIEDLCVACSGTPPGGASTWVDCWVGGKTGATGDQALAAEDALTGLHTIIKDPPSNYVVVPGDIAVTGATLYGETPVQSSAFVKAIGAPVASTSTTITLPVPASATSGDYLVAVLYSQTAASAVDWPMGGTGFARLGPAFIPNDNGTRVGGLFGQALTTAAPASYTFGTPGGTSSNRLVGVVIVLSGVDPQASIDANSAWASSAATSASLSVPGGGTAAGDFTLEFYESDYAAGNSYAVTSYTGGLSEIVTLPNPNAAEDTSVSRTVVRVYGDTAPPGGVPAHVITTSGSSSHRAAYLVSFRKAGAVVITPQARNITDNLSLTDTTRRDAVQAQGQDVLSLGDSVSAVLTNVGATTLTATVTDAVGVSDDTAIRDSVRAAGQDALGLSDSVTAALGVPPVALRVTINDSIGLTDLGSGTDSVESVPDAVAVTDAVTVGGTAKQVATASADFTGSGDLLAVGARQGSTVTAALTGAGRLTVANAVNGGLAAARIYQATSGAWSLTSVHRL